MKSLIAENLSYLFPNDVLSKTGSCPVSTKSSCSYLVLKPDVTPKSTLERPIAVVTTECNLLFTPSNRPQLLCDNLNAIISSLI